MARPIIKNTYSPTSQTSSMELSQSSKSIATEPVEEICALYGAHYLSNASASLAHILNPFM
jgi:hypothetical protein